MNQTFFSELAVGTRFIYRGRVFVKIAKCMAEDEKRLGTIFHDQVPVELEDKEEQSPGAGEKPS